MWKVLHAASTGVLVVPVYDWISMTFAYCQTPTYNRGVSEENALVAANLIASCAEALAVAVIVEAGDLEGTT